MNFMLNMKQRDISIFMVEDDLLYSAMLSHYLSLNPIYKVRVFETGKEFIKALYEKPDVVTLDYQLPDISGAELIKQVKEISPDTKIIMVSGQDDIKVAIESLKKGAHDYIVKDEETQNRLWLSMQKLLENIELKKELETLQHEVEKKYSFQKAIIGNSPAIKDIFGLMEKALRTNITVSITGETGTGKELVAKSIHFNSSRKNKSFVPVNVAAIPSELLESELFGHEKGSFTGAFAQRIGKFEEAEKGTIFLDEIGEMDIVLQAKLLRVLQEKEITRVGGSGVLPIDVRIIAATHKDLLQEVRKGKFREDLYYRLLGLTIKLPPLRERDNDILLIAKNFIDHFCKENELPRKNISVEAKKILLKYPYPGNIRELKSIIDLACVLADDEEILPEHVQIQSVESFTAKLMQERLTLQQHTLRIMQQSLDQNQYDVLKVARMLEVGKSTIYRMINSGELKLHKSALES